MSHPAPTVAAIGSPVAPIAPVAAMTAEQLSQEVDVQLREVLPKLTDWQRSIATDMLSRSPSRLHARLEAYLRNVADVESYASATVPPSIEELHLNASANEDSRPPTAASSATATTNVTRSSSAMGGKVQVVAPTLTHPTFTACLLDHMLLLLEEEWEALFSDCSTADGKRISKHERNSKGMIKPSLVYGEVAFHSFGECLWGPHFANLKTNGVFVDLGSGTGRGVFAASYLFPFAKLVGVEILEGLHQAACDIKLTYDDTVRSTIPNENIRATQQIQFHCASFLDFDWQSDADLVFANSTCFDDSLMNEIAVQGEKLRDGTYVVTLTKQLSSPYYKLLYSEQHQMSWGLATVNIMIKQTPTPEELEKDAAAKSKATVKHIRRYVPDA